MANLTPWLDQKFYLADGITPNAGGKVFSYYPGTTTKKTTYVSEDGAANTNPIILNSAGECNLWLADGGYKIVNAPATDTDPPAAAIKTWDNINVNTTGATEGAGVVDTIAALRALGEAAFSTVQTLGYYGVGDLGGSLYYWDSTSTDADNGGSVIAPTISDGTGRWIQISDGVINVRQWGARGDASTDDKTVFDTAIAAAYAAKGGIFIPDGIYYLSSLWLNGLSNGLLIQFSGSGTQLKFGNGVTDAYGTYCFRISGGCRKVTVYGGTFNFPNAIAQDCFQMGINSTPSQAYECEFYSTTFTGNSGSTLQRGLVGEQAYIHKFTACKFLSFGIVHTFKTEANSFDFIGCTIRANSGANIRLIDAQSGQQNTYTKGDIENCQSWVANSGCQNLVFDGVYFEAAVGLGAVLTGGITTWNNCLISQTRITATSGAVVYITNNRIIKTNALNYMFYPVSSVLPWMVFRDNVVEYDLAVPLTSGRMFAATDSSVQYWNVDGSGSPTTLAGTATVTNYLDICQERVWDVNTSTLKTYDISNKEGLFLSGPVNANVGQSRFKTAAFTQTTGTSPIAVSSTTKVDNLNADLLDGLDSTDFSRRAGFSSSPSVTSGNWYRIASNGTVSVGGTGGNRAYGLFTIKDSTAGRNMEFSFYAAVNFGSSPTITLVNQSIYTARLIDKIRIVWSDSVGTVEGAAVEVLVNGTLTAALKFSIYDNDAATGWVAEDFTAGSVPAGTYTTTELDISNAPIMATSVGGANNIFQLFRNGRIAGAQVPTATLPAQRHAAHYKIAGVNLNSAATDTGTFTGMPSKYRIIRLTGYDASTSLTTATFDLRTAAAGAGTALVAAFAPTALTAAAKYVDATLAAVVGTDYQTAGTLYLRNVTAQGGTATASFLLEIEDLS